MHMGANMYTSTLPWIGRFEGNPRFFFTANGDPCRDAIDQVVGGRLHVPGPRLIVEEAEDPGERGEAFPVRQEEGHPRARLAEAPPTCCSATWC